MTAPILLIVEPWFTAVGHPAQSVLNTARVLGRKDRIVYLISREQHRADLESIARDLAMSGTVHQFAVPRASLKAGTLRAALHAVRIARRQQSMVDVFFLDADLLVLAVLRPLLRLLARNVRSISALGLFGPETNSGWWLSRVLVANFLQSGNTRLFLRTEELAAAWRSAFPAARASQIDTLPSLEIPDAEAIPEAPLAPGPLRFGVLGQVRPGKGIEWLVPLFRQHPELGELRIAGALFSEGARAQLSMLEDYPGFTNTFIPQEELLPRAQSFDYLLTLYDKWDHRMEAATFYLAARARRPVICFDQGWCGRMAREFGCGLAVTPGTHLSADFFRSVVPRRDSLAYRELVQGMDRFRAAHSGDIRRTEFLRKLTGGEQ